MKTPSKRLFLNDLLDTVIPCESGVLLFFFFL